MATCPVCGSRDLEDSDLIEDMGCIYCVDTRCDECGSSRVTVDRYTHGTTECHNCGHVVCAFCGHTHDWELIEKRPGTTRDLYECGNCRSRVQLLR